MILRFYPKKDATIYEKDPEKNTGLDAILELSKIIDNTSSYNSRILVDFDYTAISASIVDLGLDPNRFSWNLRLYATEEQEIPLEYTLDCYPISQSWDMGIGRYGNSPQTTEGVSWYYRNGKLDLVSAWPTSSFAALTTGSYTTTPGGGAWYTSSAASQSFSYKAADVNMNVNSIIRAVQSGSIPFHGFVVKKQQTNEISLSKFKSIKFFSKDTHTIYSPVVEAKYDESVTNTTLTQIDTTEPYNIIAINLQSEYAESSIPTIQFGARYQYPTPTFATSSVFLDRYKLPSGTQYAIGSAQTDDIIINFSEYTSLSVDNNGNYFSLPLEGFQPERYYKILLKVPNPGSFGSQIHDNSWIFKVSRTQ